MKALILYKDWLIINRNSLEPKLFDKVTNGKEYSFIDQDDINDGIDELFIYLEKSNFIYVEIDCEIIDGKIFAII